MNRQQPLNLLIVLIVCARGCQLTLLVPIVSCWPSAHVAKFPDPCSLSFFLLQLAFGRGGEKRYGVCIHMFMIWGDQRTSAEISLSQKSTDTDTYFLQCKMKGTHGHRRWHR
ncbi:hypothetical protein BJV74DRAFT_196652 [Russula compacta]|nr:hypothetical protein BJV74DRAFT_196652 [Russula compacta]